MRLVRQVSLVELSCGCVVGRYQEFPTGRQVLYLDKKGRSCPNASHRRNARVTVSAFRAEATAPPPDEPKPAA